MIEIDPCLLDIINPDRSKKRHKKPLKAPSRQALPQLQKGGHNNIIQ
jgi:hypothetical protein